MSGSIKEFMNVGKKITSPFQALSEGMKDALVKNTQFQRSMMGLSNSIQNIYTKVLNNFLSKDLLDSIDNIIGTFSRLIDDDVADGFVKISRNLGSFINVLIGADSTADQVSSSFSKLYDSVINSKFVSRLVDIGKRMVGGIISGFIKSLPSLIGGFTDLLKLFNGTLDKQSYSNSKTGMGKFFKTYIIDSWNQVKGVLSDKKNVNGEVVSKGLVTNLLDELKKAIGVSSSLFADIGFMIGEGIWAGIKEAWSGTSTTSKLLATGALAAPIATTAATLYGGKKLLGAISGGGGKAAELTGKALQNQELAMKLKNATDLSSSTQKALAAAEAGQKLSVGQAGLINAAKAGETTMRGVSAGKWSALAGRGPAVASMGSRLAAGGNLLLGGAMIGKDIYDLFDDSQDNKFGENIGGVAGGVILGGIGAVFGGPVGAALGASVGNTLGEWIGSFWNDEEEKVNQATQANKTRREKEHQQQEQRQVQRDTEITQAIAKQASQPIVINLSIKQSLDGDELTNRILSAALNGTTRFNINTDDAGRMQLLSKNANDAGGYNPVPQA